MPKYAALLAGAWLLGCGGESRTPPPDPDPDPDPPEDPAVVCRELAPAFTAMAADVAEAMEVPREQALWVLAARLARTRRTVDELEAELAIVDSELASPDFALEPEAYRTRRLAEPARLGALRDEALAEAAALADEATRSSWPALAEPEGPDRVLASVRWRDAAPTVARFRDGCAADPSTLDPEAMRDFADGMALLAEDGHGVGTRALEERLLAGHELAGGAP